MIDFGKNLEIDFKGYIENIEGKNYLTWSRAWEAIRSRCPDVSYKIHRDVDGYPVFDRPGIGAFVRTEITAAGETHEMMLPVMDSKFKSMKTEAYEYTTKYGKKVVNAYDSHNINRSIMRCLAKNIAMFGFGLYLYHGEDMPDIMNNDLESKIDEANSKLDKAIKEPNPLIVEIKKLAEKKEIPGNIADYFNKLDVYNLQYNETMHEKNKTNLKKYKNKGE